DEALRDRIQTVSPRDEPEEVGAAESLGTAVLGAGPAGLTAAYVLARRGRPATVFEADGTVGGIAKTIEFNGYRFDLGGHRFFTTRSSARTPKRCGGSRAQRSVRSGRRSGSRTSPWEGRRFRSWAWGETTSRRSSRNSTIRDSDPARCGRRSPRTHASARSTCISSSAVSRSSIQRAE